MSFRMAYEVVHGQHGTGNAERVVRVEVEVESPQTIEEVRESISAFLTAVTGEREVLRLQDAAEWSTPDE